MSPSRPAPPPARASRAPVLRRLLLRMMVAVVALHAVAIAVYRLGGVDDAASRTRTLFTVVWMVATFALVSVFLRRIRAARRGAAARR